MILKQALDDAFARTQDEHFLAEHADDLAVSLQQFRDGKVARRLSISPEEFNQVAREHEQATDN